MIEQQILDHYMRGENRHGFEEGDDEPPPVLAFATG
jgi:hypothetical protein